MRRMKPYLCTANHTKLNTIRCTNIIYAPYTPHTYLDTTGNPMCQSAPTYPLYTATSATMILPTMTAIIVCHTDRPMATSDDPSCQLDRQIWFMAQKEMKAARSQRRRCGGSGRMSSLIQRLWTVLLEVGTCSHWRKDAVPILRGLSYHWWLE